MVDEYLKYEFEDVIGDGMKTKFKVILLFYHLVRKRKTLRFRFEWLTNFIRWR